MDGPRARVEVSGRRRIASRALTLAALVFGGAAGCAQRGAAPPAARPNVEMEQEAYRLIGFTLAHALASVSDGETLATMSFSEQDSDRKLTRYEGANLQASVDKARAELAHPASGTRWSALAFDGYAKFDGTTRVDALWIELRDARGAVTLTLAQLYRPSSKGDGVAIVWPPIVRRDDGRAHPLGATELRDVLAGVLQHPMGREILRGLRIPSPGAPNQTPKPAPHDDPLDLNRSPPTTTI
jgi:hypothetical protein